MSILGFVLFPDEFTRCKRGIIGAFAQFFRVFNIVALHVFGLFVLLDARTTR
jgi:hypothetical protein